MLLLLFVWSVIGVICSLVWWCVVWVMMVMMVMGVVLVVVCS